MTSTTEPIAGGTETSDVAIDAPHPHSVRLRFGVAFILGLVATLAVGVGSLYGYGQLHVGRILPGVRVGPVDLSGLNEADASARLTEAFAGYADGSVRIQTGTTDVTIPYSAFGRHADVPAMVTAALAVGRDGSAVEQAVAEVRTAVRGVELRPIVTFDHAALADQVDAVLVPLEMHPVDATISVGDTGIVTTPSMRGRSFDQAAVTAAIARLVRSPDAGAEVVATAQPASIDPAVDTAAVLDATKVASRMIQPLTLEQGKESWTIDADTVQTWLRFDISDGQVLTTLDPAAIAKSLAPIAKKAETKPVNASFLTGKNGAVVGVTASKDGRTLDAQATAGTIIEALTQRGTGGPSEPIQATFAVATPKLTTAEAEKAAPLMQKISSWTTYFDIVAANGWGTNIWIPARIINGTVLAPGQKFEWWSAIGPVTPARGYLSGGVIKNGKSEPTGALGGGMCSSSTTLFNAALRAGLQMGARLNHYYYISRYPLGLDATVFIEGSSVATMSFTNDTPYPILIRGYAGRSGAKGTVTYEMWSVPTGRKVSLSTPIVKNVVPARTYTVYTTSIPAGTRNQTEFATDGKDVWVTRLVTDASGKVIHKETYYSHYAKVDGMIYIGKAAAPAPKPAPSPSPSPSPTPAP